MGEKDFLELGKNKTPYIWWLTIILDSYLIMNGGHGHPWFFVHDDWVAVLDSLICAAMGILSTTKFIILDS